MVQECCFNYYGPCTGLQPCFEYLSVRLPDTYTEADVVLKFNKAGQGQGITIRVSVSTGGGWAVVPVESVPDGFFNPFTQYRVEFWGDNGYTLVSFLAKDGKNYDGIDFYFDNCVESQQYITLNAINDLYND